MKHDCVSHVAVLPLLIALCGAWGCNPGGATEPSPDEASASNVMTPFAIDRGNVTGAPSTYKGLPLGLTPNSEPRVDPADGIVGVVCVGMSNGNQECADFQSRVVGGAFAGQINPGVRVVNCAVGGHAIEKWIDPAFDGQLWNRCINQVLPAAGVRLDQVRVLWHKAANQFTTGPGGTPLPPYPSADSDYMAFSANLSAFAARVRTHFPDVQAVYSSSRSYGGYSSGSSRGEPLSYEEGHALNQWLLRNPIVDGVWYGWGPYIWAPACSSGATNASLVCYDRADFVEDGVHPAPSGRAKVSQMLHARFRQHAWYRNP